jgi:heterodisulfide reductase subunit C
MATATINRDPRREAELRAAYWDQVATFPDGYKVKNCIQCGSCTGSCPVAHAMDITPRQIVALFRAGYLEDILRSRAIWICASCYACTVRCPAGIRVTDNLYALKRVAERMHIFPEKLAVHSLSETFVKNVRRYGRNWELWLGLKYLLGTNPKKLLSPQTQRFALDMFKRKRLALKPTRINKVHEVQAIIDKAERMGVL